MSNGFICRMIGIQFVKSLSSDSWFVVCGSWIVGCGSWVLQGGNTNIRIFKIRWLKKINIVLQEAHYQEHERLNIIMHHRKST